MNVSDLSRNLVFAFLALQNDFISREELIAAVSVWLKDKSKPLDEVLLERKALPENQRELLNALVGIHLEKHDNDADKSLAALSSVGNIRHQLQQFGDEELERSLLHVASNSTPEDFLTAETLTRDTQADDRGRFRILRPHAKGGIGEVFVAHDVELSREVALKEIQQRHADHPESRSRFVLEAEVTGGLEHPGIVPIYGLGQYGDGRPYYAMRFIRGDSLKEAIDQFHRTQFVDQNERSLQLRKLLGRFVDVCNAIQYAHSRGVLHRDLKPGNIMLGKYGETLVVDWGLAKVKGRDDESRIDGETTLHPKSTSGSAPTQTGSAVGTPAYMSPEQAAGRLNLLGPASDVYSLGATLYCLLTGRPPADGDNLGEVLNCVQRGDFPKPRAIKPNVPPSLEAICLKAMSRDAGSRYQSPAAMADDIENWLADEPVTAFPEPLVTRAGRWGRRHKTLVASSAVLLISAVTALTIGIILLGKKQAEVARERNAAIEARDEAAEERNKAQQSKDIADAVNRFFIGDLLSSVQLEKLGKDVTVQAALDEAAKKLDTAFADQPKVEAEVRHAVGRTYQSLSLHFEAEPHLHRAVELRREHLGAEHPDTLTAIDSLAELLTWTGKVMEAAKLFEDNLKTRQRVLGYEHPDSLTSLSKMAWSLMRRGRYRESEQLGRECLEARTRILGSEHPETLITKENLAQVLLFLQQLDEAEKLLLENLDTRRRVLGPEHPHTLHTLNDIGLMHSMRDDHEKAEEQYQELLDIQLRVMGPSHRETLLTKNNLAQTLVARGKDNEAEEMIAEVLEIRRLVLGDRHPDTLVSLNDLAIRTHKKGSVDEAAKMFEDLLNISREEFGPNYVGTIRAIHNLAFSLNGRNQWDKAAELYRQAADLRRQILGQEHPDTLSSIADLAGVLASLGDIEEGEQLKRSVLDTQRRVLGPEHSETVRSMHNLGYQLWNRGQLAEAEKLQRDVLDIWQRQLGPDHPSVLTGMSNLGLTIKDQGRLEEAEQVFRAALAARRRVLGPKAADTLHQERGVAGLLKEQGKWNDAEAMLRGCLATARTAFDEDHLTVQLAMDDLAWTVLGQGKTDEAVSLFEKVLEIDSRLNGPEHRYTVHSMTNLALALQDQNELDEAEELCQKALPLQRRDLPSEHGNIAFTLSVLGRVLLKREKPQEAEPLLREALRIRKKTPRPQGQMGIGGAESLLGECLAALGRHEEAEPLLLSGYENLRATIGVPPRRLREAVQRIVRLYGALEKPDEAAKWQHKLADLPGTSSSMTDDE